MANLAQSVPISTNQGIRTGSGWLNKPVRI